jgi:hypothetical protein
MFWLIPISIFLLLIVWILLVPVILFINTEKNRYAATLRGVFHVAVIPSDGLFLIKGWILFIPFKFNPFRPRRKKSRRKPRSKKRKKKKGTLQKLSNNRRNLSMFRKLLGAFKIKKLQLNVDTEDFTLNAWLIPLFSYVNSEHVLMQVNYTGTAKLLLDLRIRIGTLIWIFMKYKFKSIY